MDRLSKLFWASPSPSTQVQNESTKASASSSNSSPSASACPVDHEARAAWLENAARSRPKDLPPEHPGLSFSQQRQPRPLSLDREVSTIPRAAASPSDPQSTKTSNGSEGSHLGPSGHEDANSSNWVYPSERMFYDAMKRKNYEPQAEDMRSIIPLHNAVNERAWGEILAWERAAASQPTPPSPHSPVLNPPNAIAMAPPKRVSSNAFAGTGPKLLSFAGDASRLTPRARINTFLGYEKPFDRHDWVVERPDGEKVEYVIDFYRGRGGEGKVSFFLDVRPKLNSWEGVKMRMSRALGLG